MAYYALEPWDMDGALMASTLVNAVNSAFGGKQKPKLVSAWDASLFYKPERDATAQPVDSEAFQRQQAANLAWAQMASGLAGGKIDTRQENGVYHI